MKVLPIKALKSLKKWTFGPKMWRFIQILLYWWFNQEWRFICVDTVFFHFRAAADSWEDEYTDMDAQGSALISSYYGSPGLNNQNCELYICWDHYTQMIWKDTSQVCSLIMYCSYVFLNIFLTLFFKYLPTYLAWMCSMCR